MPISIEVWTIDTSALLAISSIIDMAVSNADGCTRLLRFLSFPAGVLYILGCINQSDTCKQKSQLEQLLVVKITIINAAFSMQDTTLQEETPYT